jgi:LuxR family maltose regulon positive regulatory protein
MLQTSVLDRLSSSLCNAVTGRSDSQSLLNTLERANLFVLPLDNRREWFRYHQLFANLLQQRLLDTAGAVAVFELKHRASQWHAAHGNIIDAAEIALSCGDYEHAAAIIEASNQSLFISGELNTLHQWSERIPAAVIAAHMRLNIMAFWASYSTGHPQQSERFVQLLEQTIGVSVTDFLEDSPASCELSSLERSALLDACAMLTSIAVDSLDLEKAFSFGEQVLARMVSIYGEPFAFNPPENLRCPTLFNLGRAHEYTGDLEKAARLFSEAETDARERENPHVLALAIGHLGEVQAMQGLTEQARRTYERALEAANAYSLHSSAFWGLAFVGLGELAFEQGDMETAEANFHVGVEQGKIWNAWECLLPGMLGQARFHATRGEWPAAYATLDDLLERTTKNALTVRPAVEAERAAFQLQQGDLVSAAHWASTFDAAHPAAYRLQWEQNALIAAQIWLAQGKQTEARALLSRLLSDARSGSRQQIVHRVQQITHSNHPSWFLKSTRTDLIEPLSQREL